MAVAIAKKPVMMTKAVGARFPGHLEEAVGAPSPGFLNLRMLRSNIEYATQFIIPRIPQNWLSIGAMIPQGITNSQFI